MTRFSRRLLAGVLLPLAAAGPLAACGDDEPSSSAGAPAAESTPAGGAAAATSPAKTGTAAVDDAFVRQMIPHHQMAVGMAEIAKTRAQHAELKTLATAVVETQNAEIEQLEAIAERLGVRAAAAPEGGMAEAMGHGEGHEGMDHGSGDSADGGAMDHGAMGSANDSVDADAKTLGLEPVEVGMSMDIGGLETADPFDVAFIDAMTPHHDGAIAMAKAQIERGEDPELTKVAKAILAAQEKEVAEMAAWKAKW